jgi:hypothetical protein
MDPREAQEIMSQGAIRPETSRDREERRILDADWVLERFPADLAAVPHA